MMYQEVSGQGVPKHQKNRVPHTSVCGFYINPLFDLTIAPLPFYRVSILLEGKYQGWRSDK